MDKPMTLPSYEYRDKFSGTGQRVLSIFADGSIVGRGANAGLAGWLRRRALPKYSGLVFSVLDALRAGGNCAGARGPHHFQGLGNARRTTRAFRRDAVDCLCRHLRDVADMAVLKNTHE